MIQDIKPHKYTVAYQNVKAKENDCLLIYRDGNILCQESQGQIAYPLIEDVMEKYPDILSGVRYLFEIDGRGYFDLPGKEVEPFFFFLYLPKEELRRVRPMWKAFAGITGFQMQEWYGNARFCGRCGKEMKHHLKERAMVCPLCGHISYPQICPSVIVAITDKDRILLTKYASGHSSFKRYALVAGYSEVGESLEDTVRREVMEEVGLRVKNIRYYKSQPWSFSGALLAGFVCEVEGSSSIFMDDEELSAAEWFGRDNMPKDRSQADISLTGEMMQAFEDGLL